MAVDEASNFSARLNENVKSVLNYVEYNVSSIFSNISKQEEKVVINYFPRDMMFISAMIASSLLAMCGNGFTFKVIITEKNMRSTINSLIANMAFSDAACGFFIILQFYFCSLNFYENCSFGIHVCSMLQSVTYTTYFVSAFTMTTIASDRFRGIVAKPLGSRVKPAKRIAVIWLVAFLFNFPVYSTISVPEYFSKSAAVTFRVLHQYSWSKVVMQIRITITFISQFLLPLIVTSFAYIQIMNVIKKRKIIGQQFETQKQQFQQQKLKLLKMLMVIVIIFAVAWFPIHFSLLFITFTGHAFVQVDEVPTTFLALYWFACSSNCVNPFVYFWYYKEFRVHLKNSWKSISRTSLSLMDISVISRNSVNFEHSRSEAIKVDRVTAHV
ncbi:neuropeptide Y receptor type 1-like protein [Leptotrombidium deliense]|uniref:Neuropeptide Y receptor type 1-like protein n=1 Tax=Leptotrombidium deliense TaxID=299467 RepID=A0A443SDT1_9ACAR|nr:neuropeptide Y receptor type 1-like protein [Leptotrombidium deliense]